MTKSANTSEPLQAVDLRFWTAKGVRLELHVWGSRVFNPATVLITPKRQEAWVHASSVCPQVAGAVRETRPPVPLGLGRWDRFKQPLTCGNNSLEGTGTRMLRASQPS